MKRLAQNLYQVITNLLGLKHPVDACVVGCTNAFVGIPEVEVNYILRDDKDNIIGGKLHVQFKLHILGSYSLYVLEHVSKPLYLSEGELKDIGLGETNFETIHKTTNHRLIDNHQSWLLKHMKCSKFGFKENIPVEFENLVKTLVETKSE